MRSDLRLPILYAVLAALLTGLSAWGFSVLAGPVFADSAVPGEYSEHRAGDIYPETIGEQAVIGPGREPEEIAEGLVLGYARHFINDHTGMDVLEMYAENNSRETMTLFVTRASTDGLETDRRLFERILPGHRTFVQLETKQVCLSLSGPVENRTRQFRLLVLSEGKTEPLYNNNVTCLPEAAAAAPAPALPEQTVSADQIEVGVWGLRRWRTEGETRVVLLTGIRNDSGREISCVLKDVTFDGCVGVSSFGVWCSPGQTALLTAEVTESEFREMAEREDAVEVSFRVESLYMEPDGTYAPCSGESRTEILTFVTGMLPG